MNHDIESQLREALQRRQPPPGWTARLEARVSASRRRSPFWLAAAAVVIVSFTGGLLQYRQQQQAEKARRDLMLALEITAGKLELVRNHIQQ
jgi:hypothetical protein